MFLYKSYLVGVIVFTCRSCDVANSYVILSNCKVFVKWEMLCDCEVWSSKALLGDCVVK